jgi:GLPGLI family protein
MKVLINLTLLILGIFANAQNKRFTYDYQFIPDSTNVSDVKNEAMNLDISESGSKFYSYTVYSSDSLMKIDVEKQMAAGGILNLKSNNRKGLVRYAVTKKYPKYEVFLQNRILRDQYNVSEERPIIWKITSEKLKVGEWNTQKAETDFAGRHWYAWFTTDIPIQDGPYKFHGLPGLIVKMEDQTQSHRFTLKAVKNISSIPKDVFGANEISVNAKQYSKILMDYEDDPTRSLKQAQMGGAIMVTKDGQSSNIKDQEASIKTKMKKDNNKIELVKM